MAQAIHYPDEDAREAVANLEDGREAVVDDTGTTWVWRTGLGWVQTNRPNDVQLIPLVGSPYQVPARTSDAASVALADAPIVIQRKITTGWTGNTETAVIDATIAAGVLINRWLRFEAYVPVILDTPTAGNRQYRVRVRVNGSVVYDDTLTNAPTRSSTARQMMIRGLGSYINGSTTAANYYFTFAHFLGNANAPTNSPTGTGKLSGTLNDSDDVVAGGITNLDLTASLSFQVTLTLANDAGVSTVSASGLLEIV